MYRMYIIVPLLAIKLFFVISIFTLYFILPNHRR